VREGQRIAALDDMLVETIPEALASRTGTRGGCCEPSKHFAPAGMCPGHHIKPGTRQPPSNAVPFETAVGPGGENAGGANRTDTIDLAQPVGRRLDYVEDLLAECPHELLGVNGTVFRPGLCFTRISCRASSLPSYQRSRSGKRSSRTQTK
jgi:hypothetical protein